MAMQQQTTATHSPTRIVLGDIGLGGAILWRGAPRAVDASGVGPASARAGGRTRTIRQSGTITAIAHTPYHRNAPRQPIASCA